MAPISSDHHHRSTTKSTTKAFKTRHASKSALKDRAKGKVESFERGQRKTPQQQMLSKLGRRNQAKQKRINHHAEREERASVFTGRDAAPRIVAVVPLCADADERGARQEVLVGLNESVEAEGDLAEAANGMWNVEVPRFKQRLVYLTPERELFACLDACRSADYVLFLLSAEQEVDELGEQLLRCIESQGVSTVITGAYGVSGIETAKRRPDVLRSLKSYINHFFATQEKVHDMSSRQECSNVMRSLCTTMPKGVHWREERSWMVVQDLSWKESGTAVVIGVVRGRSLKADRLVQVGDWGDMQIEKIVAAPLDVKQKRVKLNEMEVDDAHGEMVLEEPSEEQDDLAELAPEVAMVDDDMSMPPPSLAPSERRKVLLDDHHYFHNPADDVEIPKRLPRGTSNYQAAWYLDDVSDSGSDLESLDGDAEGNMGMDSRSVLGPADGNFDAAVRDPTEIGAPSEYPQSEMFQNAAPEEEAEQIAAYRAQRHDEAAEDLEFPDEIELDPNVLARERLAKYRGLKSLRTSAWDTEEDRPYEPDDWRRLLEIRDYKAARGKVLKDTLLGGVSVGTRVEVHLRVSDGQQQSLQAMRRPTALFSLLRHEHKRTSVNVSLNLSSEYDAPLRSKETLIMQCGPRRLVINPLFSQAGNTPNDVHKFDRYLHPGRTAVASFIGPVIWGSVPCLFFKPDSSSSASSDPIESLASDLHSKAANLSLIGTGTFLPPSTNRVIAKRILLTGHPYKIHKNLVTIRYMFFNNEDVEFFRALQLWTKRGRSGFIKETLGTHGYFKATFDGKLNPLDAVAVSLYKRVWPRPAVSWHPGQVLEAASRDVPQLMDSAVE